MFQPLSDRVLIRRKASTEKVGSLYVAPASATKPDEGSVVAVGPGRTTVEGVLLPMVLEPGMDVLFGQFTGDEVTVGEETMLVVREADVLAVLNE